MTTNTTPASILVDALRSGVTKVPLSAESFEDAVGQLLRPALARANITDERDVETCLETVLTRESAGSTASGRISLPHGRCSKVARVVAAVGVNREGVFGDGDVQIVLAFLSPQQGVVEHLHFLSAAAKVFRDEEMVERLLAANDGNELIQVLTDREQPSR